MAETSRPHKTKPLKDARTSMQKLAFTLWLNRRLKKFNIVIDDVFKDLADGKALFCLVESLTKKKLRRQQSFADSRNRYFQMESVGLALKYLRKEGVALRNIGPEDIVDGRENLILGLLWTLMSHFEYRALAKSWSSGAGGKEGAGSGESGAGSRSASFKERMLELVQDKLPTQTVRNFGDDWANGSSLVQLVNSMDSGLAKKWPTLKDDCQPSSSSSSNLEKVRCALDAAESELQIPKLFSAEDLLGGQVDEGSMMLYLSQFFIGQEDAEVSGESGQNEADVLRQFKACSAARRSFASRRSNVHSLVTSINSMDDGYETQSNGRRASRDDEVDDENKEGRKGTARKSSQDTGSDSDSHKKYDSDGSDESGKDGTSSADSGHLDKVDGMDDMLVTTESDEPDITSDDDVENSDDDDEEDDDDDDSSGDDGDDDIIKDLQERGRITDEGSSNNNSNSSSNSKNSSSTNEAADCEAGCSSEGLPRHLQGLDSSVIKQYLAALKHGADTVYEGRVLLTSPSQGLASSLKETLLDHKAGCPQNNGSDNPIRMTDGRNHSSLSSQRACAQEEIQLIDTNFPTESVFQTNRDIWVIALDVSQSLDSCIQDGGDVTVREFLHQCLGCIHSQKRERRGSKELWDPPVVIVGTTGDEQETITRRQQLLFKREVRHFLKHKVYAPHVYDIILLNRDSTEDTLTLQLAALKLSVSQKQWGREDPTRWCNLLRSLKDEAKEAWPVVKLQQVKKLASNTGLNTADELQAFLVYYHAVQEVIHEDGILVLKPQWLYDVSRKMPAELQSNIKTSDFNEVSGLFAKLGIILPWHLQQNGQRNYLHLSHSSQSDSVSNHAAHAPDIYLKFTSSDQPFETDGDGILPVSLFHVLVSRCHFNSGWQWTGTVDSDVVAFAPVEINPYTICLKMLKEAIQIFVQLPADIDPDSNVLKEHLPSVLSTMVNTTKTVLQEHFPNLECQLSVNCGHVANRKNRLGKAHKGSLKNYMTRQRLDRQSYLPLRPDDVAFGETVWCDAHELAVDVSRWTVWFDTSV